MPNVFNHAVKSQLCCRCNATSILTHMVTSKNIMTWTSHIAGPRSKLCLLVLRRGLTCFPSGIFDLVGDFLKDETVFMMARAPRCGKRPPHVFGRVGLRIGDTGLPDYIFDTLVVPTNSGAMSVEIFKELRAVVTDVEGMNNFIRTVIAISEKRNCWPNLRLYGKRPHRMLVFAPEQNPWEQLNTPYMHKHESILDFSQMNMDHLFK